MLASVPSIASQLASPQHFRLSASRVCTTVSNSPYPSRAWMTICKHGKSLLINLFVCCEFRCRLQEAKLECATVKKELEESISERGILEERNTKNDRRINELSTRLKHSDENARKQVDQVSFI